jgi:hypothetical protein
MFFKVHLILTIFKPQRWRFRVYKNWVVLCKDSTKEKKKTCAGILEQSMGAKNRVGIGLLYRPAWLHRLAESIPGLHKSLKIPPLLACREYCAAMQVSEFRCGILSWEFLPAAHLSGPVSVCAVHRK